MTQADNKIHWERVYETRAPDDLSWYQINPQRSLELIELTGAGPDSAIIDVGGGDSLLVDALLGRGMRRVTVLDISGAALGRARKRLGSRSNGVCWIEADVTRASLDSLAYDVWHDRAVFHFLTNAANRKRYVETVRAVLKVGGHAIVATFAADGPTRCSGLDVKRYSPVELYGEFGDQFELVTSREEMHRTPAGAAQHFIYCLCRKE